MKIFDLAPTVAEFNPISWKISVLRKNKKKIKNYQLIKIFLEDKTQQLEEWKNIGRFHSATHRYLQLGLARNIGMYSWKKNGTADTYPLTDELHNETLGFSLKTYNMPAPEIQFSFKLCSLWRKLNYFKKHLPFTKKCRKKKTLWPKRI